MARRAGSRFALHRAEAQSAAKIAAAKRKLDSAIEDANANLESQQRKFAIDNLQGQDTDALLLLAKEQKVSTWGLKKKDALITRIHSKCIGRATQVCKKVEAQATKEYKGVVDAQEKWIKRLQREHSKTFCKD